MSPPSSTRDPRPRAHRTWEAWESEVLLIRWGQGCTDEEIAAGIGRPVSSVRDRLWILRSATPTLVAAIIVEAAQEAPRDAEDVAPIEEEA